VPSGPAGADPGDGGVLPTRPLASGGAALVAPVADEKQDAPPEADEEVLPQRVRPRVAPVTKSKPSRRLNPGDLVCGECGEGNPPTRKFCSRCGEPLTTAEVVKAKWYRPLLFWRREPRTLEAGARPGKKGAKGGGRGQASAVYRKVRAAVAALLLLVSLLYIVAPPVRGLVDRWVVEPAKERWDQAVQWFEDLTDNYVEVAPTRATAVPADAQTRDHPAGNVMDRDNSFWAAPFRRSDPPGVRLSFSEAQSLPVVFVTGGGSGEDADGYLHPRLLRFTYGSGNSERCELAEPSGEPQRCDLEQALTTRRITVTVLRVFPKEGLRRVAIQDIQFQRPKD
jgi:hypothetical protein